jgi:hypothetical protein
MQDKEITIPYKAREWAKAFHSCGKKLIVLVLHRRCGKTVASINHLIRECFKSSDIDQRYAYIAPTYKQAKNVAWDVLKRFASKVPHTKFNEAELRCDFSNGSRITLYGADNPDALRGIGLWGVVFDEYSQQPSNIYSEIILPALADHQGFAIWIGTPKGKNEFYKLYEQAQTDPDFFHLRLGASETGLVDKDYLRRAKQRMTEDEYNQEFECSFEGSTKGAYYGEELSSARSQGRIREVPWEPLLGVTTAWDLGIRDSTAIGFFQFTGNEIRMIDYYEGEGMGLDHYVKIIREKPYIYDRHIAPHDIAVKELGSGRSRLEMAEMLGINFDICENIPVADGIQAVRSIFPRLYIHKKYDSFVNALSQYRKEWDDKKGHFKDKPLHDWTSHSADMLRYLAVGTRVDDNTEDDFEQINTDY